MSGTVQRQQRRVDVQPDDACAGKPLQHAIGNRSESTGEIQHVRRDATRGIDDVEHGREPFLAVRQVALLLPVPTRRPALPIHVALP